MKKIQTIHQDLVKRVQLQYGLKLSVLSDNQNTSTSTYTSAQTNNRRYARTQANTHRDTHTDTNTILSQTNQTLYFEKACEKGEQLCKVHITSN